jgi:hypothetical protein
MPPTRSVVIRTSVILYLLAQLFFLINIQFPAKPNFDEFHYVPSAKQVVNVGAADRAG